MSVKDDIRQALHDAIDWQAGIADAYVHITGAPERIAALAQIERYRRILKTRYGRTKRPLDEMLDRAKAVPVWDLLRQNAEKGKK